MANPHRSVKQKEELACPLSQNLAAVKGSSAPRLRSRSDRPGHRRRHLFGNGTQALARQPEAAGLIRANQILGFAFCEALALIGLVMPFVYVSDHDETVSTKGTDVITSG